MTVITSACLQPRLMCKQQNCVFLWPRATSLLQPVINQSNYHFQCFAILCNTLQIEVLESPSPWFRWAFDFFPWQRVSGITSAGCQIARQCQTIPWFRLLKTESLPLPFSFCSLVDFFFNNVGIFKHFGNWRNIRKYRWSTVLDKFDGNGVSRPWPCAGRFKLQILSCHICCYNTFYKVSCCCMKF